MDLASLVTKSEKNFHENYSDNKNSNLIKRAQNWLSMVKISKSAIIEKKYDKMVDFNYCQMNEEYE